LLASFAHAQRHALGLGAEADQALDLEHGGLAGLSAHFLRLLDG